MKSQAGFSLLEVMIAGVLTSMGLVGFTALLFSVVLTTSAAEDRTKAAILIDELAGQIAVSPSANTAFQSEPPEAVPDCSGGAVCSAADFATFQKKVQAELPQTRIMFVAIKPSIKRWNLYPKMAKANQMISDLCASESRLTYLDIATPMLGEDGKPMEKLFAKDGLHLSEAGYELWTPIIATHLDDGCKLQFLNE